MLAPFILIAENSQHLRKFCHSRRISTEESTISSYLIPHGFPFCTWALPLTANIVPSFAPFSIPSVRFPGWTFMSYTSLIDVLAFAPSCFAIYVSSDKFKPALSSGDKWVQHLITIFHPSTIEISAIRHIFANLTIFVLDPKITPLRISDRFIRCLFEISQVSPVLLEIFNVI